MTLPCALANGIRGYTNKVRLRGLALKIGCAEAHFVCVAAVLTAKLNSGIALKKTLDRWF